MQSSPDQLAAVDLGSNSFHMVVATVERGRIRLVDRIRQRTAIAAGLGSDGRLAENARTRAIECLQQLSQRIRDLPPEGVRVVGTNTFRKVRDGGAFLRNAEQAIGHTIEILGGAEEARLVFVGVRYDVGPTELPLLAIDIGGGSTELAIGRGDAPDIAESVQIGCVALSADHFEGGRLSSKRMQRAKLAASLELEPVAHRFDASAADVVASSGTALAIEGILREAGWCESGITRPALDRLRDTVIEAGHVDELSLEGLSEGRRPVLAGGVAAMLAVFDALDIEQLRTSRCALREGVLVDLVGRIAGHDRRDASIEALAERVQIDQRQADRVARTAARLLELVRGVWNLPEDSAALLHWSALLHEAGLSISHTDYHRHGEYIIAHTDLPGFSRTTQEMLAAIVRLHRKRISWNRLPEGDEQARLTIRDLSLLLRVSAHLHRGRVDASVQLAGGRGTPDGLELTIASDQAQQHPLTMADLAIEAGHWNRMGRTLDVTVVDA